MQNKPPSNNLPEHNNAIGSYLDDMLHEAGSSISAAGSAQTLALRDPDLVLPELFLHALEEQIPPVSAPAETVIATIDCPEPHPQPVALVTQPGDEPEAETNNPGSENFPLQCLLFRVGDHLLSMPLIQMQAVLPWPENLTCLPQSPDWMRGLIKYREQNIRVVDSAKIFSIKSIADPLPRYILVLGEAGWAITCNQLDDVIILQHEDLQWHPNASHSMSTGTIRDSLASLLNPVGIVNILNP